MFPERFDLQSLLWCGIGALLLLIVQRVSRTSNSSAVNEIVHTKKHFFIYGACFLLILLCVYYTSIPSMFTLTNVDVPRHIHPEPVLTLPPRHIPEPILTPPCNPVACVPLTSPAQTVDCVPAAALSCTPVACIPAAITLGSTRKLLCIY